MAVTLPADAEARLRAGALVVLPTDTVYGVGCAAYRSDACERLYMLKARPTSQPTAVVAGTLAGLLDLLPELDGAAAERCRSLLPGPVTLIVPNPARRFAYLCGDDPTRLGVRVPVLDPAVAALADAVGGLALTSANLRGGVPARRADGVPPQVAAACAFVADGGELPGTPSAVLDVTGPEPVVLRDGPGLRP